MTGKPTDVELSFFLPWTTDFHKLTADGRTQLNKETNRAIAVIIFVVSFLNPSNAIQELWPELHKLTARTREGDYKPLT